MKQLFITAAVSLLLSVSPVVATAQAQASCYFYVGHRSGRLIAVNDGGTNIRFVAGEENMFDFTLRPGESSYIGWPDDVAWGLSGDTAVCNWRP